MPNATLRPDHADHLARFRITPEVLEAACVRSATDFETRELLGLNGGFSGDLAGIVFPYFSPATGHRTGARVRLDHPLSDGGKYISERGSRHLFFPPGTSDTLRDAAVTAVLVEAEKSALSLESLCGRTDSKLLPIALGGCWGWKRTTGKRAKSDGTSEAEKGPSPDFDLVTWAGRKVIIALDSNTASNVKVRAARAALVMELTGRGADVYVSELPEGINGPDDLIGERGDDAMLSVLDSAAAAGRPLRTDGGNSDRYAREHADSVRWCSDQGTWHAWDGKRWRRNAIGEVMRRARRTAARAWDEVKVLKEETDKEKAEKKLLAKWAMHLDSRGGLESMVSLARYNVSLEVTRFNDVFDCDPLLLNCKNGIVDLKTGTLSPHRREAMLTKMAGVAYDPKVRIPKFADLLAKTFGDFDLIEYVQRLVGFCLTGLTDDQVFFIFYGPARTGKSTFVLLLRSLLGEYALSLPEGALLARKFHDDDKDAKDVAKLPGVRLATAVETAAGRKLNEAKIKQLTGNDYLIGRNLYEDPFEFLPQCKLILATNFLPRVKDTDESIWRRIKPVEFCKIVPKNEEVKKLEKKLIEEEGPGILAWAVEGCMKWLKDGLQEPECVTRAANRYRKDQDEIAQWAEEACLRCDKDHEHSHKLAKKGECEEILSSALYANFTEGAKKDGIRNPVTKTKFSLELKRLRFLDDSTGGVARWVGIRLRTAADDEKAEAEKEA